MEVLGPEENCGKGQGAPFWAELSVFQSEPLSGCVWRAWGAEGNTAA